MSPHGVLLEAQRRGINLAAVGHSLRVDAPRGALTPELRQAIAAFKPDLPAEHADPRRRRGRAGRGEAAQHRHR